MSGAVHHADAYDQLVLLCENRGWGFGVGMHKGTMQLQVRVDGKVRETASCQPGHENDAADDLLFRLRRPRP